MRLANEDPDQGGTWSEWEPYSETKLWSLKPGEGTRQVWLQLMDEYDNVSGFIASNQVTVDLTNPSPPANLGLQGVTGNLPAWRWDTSTDDYLKGYEVRVGTKSGLGDVVPGTGEVNARSVGLVASWVQDVEAPHRGEYSLQVRAVDLAGNTSPWVTSGPFTVTWPANYSYTYDDIGNRKTQDRFGTSSTYTYNDAGQLTRITRGSEIEDFEYDPAGNTTRRTKGDQVWEYEYDEENRLVTVSRTKGTEPKAWVAKYVYDPDGLRVRSVFSGTSEHPGGWTVVHLNQGTDTIYEAIYDGINDPDASLAGLVPTRRLEYVSGGGMRLGKIEKDASGNQRKYFYLTDHLGSTRMVTDKDGNVVVSMAYEPFGQLLDASGATEDEAYRFTGKPYDDPIGLYYYGARFYDAAIGRFITQDRYTRLPDDERVVRRDAGADAILRRGTTTPMAQNRYAYCIDNPMNVVDPTGLDFMLLNDPDAALWQGHNASLAGSDLNGWKYFSKDGDPDKNVMKSFKTLAEFLKSPEAKRYHRAYLVDATLEQDEAMRAYGEKNYGRPYAVTQYTYGKTGITEENCADLSWGVGHAGGLKIEQPQRTILLTFTWPNEQFDEFMETETGQLLNFE